jgi:dTDP-4-dehydrorhamnose reductase
MNMKMSTPVDQDSAALADPAPSSSLFPAHRPISMPDRSHSRTAIEPPAFPEAVGALELWGGVECTVARIGDRYVDQVRLSGHEAREDDVDRLAALGVRRVRYPLLWERVAPTGLDEADWSWTDERLARLRERGIMPIAGLVHHGSGPPGTSLRDPGFATGLAAFAGAVAERYPWIDAYVPVNEPLTTARFSGLYGFWYPHASDEQSFLAMLVIETQASIMAMRAIRQHAPRARFVLTEDLSYAHATPALEALAERHNQRRWIGIDLLCGRVVPGHPYWDRFVDAGLEAELEAIAADPCPPDVLGFNHYLTSERFLDHQIERYDPRMWSRDEGHEYVDLEAMRIVLEGPRGLEALLREAWQRYRIPLAVTEVHNGSTRDEQMRWLMESWSAANRLKATDVDIRAVTIWSTFGCTDWNSLMIEETGHYEPGPYDIRAPEPRATALARMARGLAIDGDYDHPVLDAPGVWRRPDRFHWRPTRASPFASPIPEGEPVGRNPPRRLLIVGATGTLGRAFARMCALRGLAFDLVSRAELDIADVDHARAAVAARSPWAIINAAGYVRVDDAEKDEDLCFRENARGPAVLAALADDLGIPLVTFSSDLVFDGAARRPYVENDAPCPISAYGRGKAKAEALVLNACQHALVVRTSAFFGPWDRYNFVTHVVAAVSEGRTFTALEDCIVSPTYVPHLVDTTLDLLIDGETGIWHLANGGSVSWYELAQDAARRAGLDPGLVEPTRLDLLDLPAPRPTYSVLGSNRGRLMPSLDAGLSAFFDARAEGWGRFLVRAADNFDELDVRGRG